MTRITHQHRETRKSKVLKIPSYHIARPPITEEGIRRLQEATLLSWQFIINSLNNRHS